VAVRDGSTHRIVIEGLSAVVRFGYQKAATLGRWRVEGEWLTAAVLDCDGFRITQSPLIFELTYADGAPTRRRLADVTVHAGQLQARLIKSR
jgi:hypothetical protein